MHGCVCVGGWVGCMGVVVVVDVWLLPAKLSMFACLCIYTSTCTCMAV